jgi:hypothetical protein
LPVFRERYDLRLTDVRATDRDGAPVEGVQVQDLVEAEEQAIRGLFRGCDAVVHLGSGCSGSRWKRACGGW